MEQHSVGDLKKHTQKSKAIHCKRKLGRNTEPVQLQHLRLPTHTGGCNGSTSPRSKSFTQKLQLVTVTRQTHKALLCTTTKRPVLQSEASSSNSVRNLLLLKTSTFWTLAAEVEGEPLPFFLSFK